MLALAGGLLAFGFQVISSEREEAQKVMDNTSTLIMSRIFEMERVKWALESGNLNDAKILFKKYQNNSEVEWNTKSLIYWNGIGRYFDKSTANKLIHDLFNNFSNTHASIKKWLFCIENYQIQKNYSIQNEDVINCGKKNCNNCNCASIANCVEEDFSDLRSSGTTYITDLNECYQKQYQSFWPLIKRLKRDIINEDNSMDCKK